MKSGMPWSIRGIDDETREAARAAARQAGVPVSEWLNDLIAEKAGEQGILPAAVGGPEDDGEAALAESVSRLDSRIRSLGGSRAMAGLRASLDEIERHLARLTQMEPGGWERETAVRDVAAMVESLSRDIDNADERARTTIEGLSGRFPASPSTSPPERDEIAAAIRHIERQMHTMPEPAPPQPAASFEELKLRLDELLAKAPPPPPSAGPPIVRAPIDATLRSLEDRIDAARAKLLDRNRAEAAEEPMRRIEERLSEIAGHLSRREEPEPRHPPAQPRRGDDLASAIAQISARQRALDVPPDLLRERDLSNAVKAIRTDISALTDKVFAFGRGGAEDKGAFFDLARRIDALAAEKPVDRTLLSGMRSDLEAIRKVLDGTPERPGLAARLDGLMERTLDPGKLDTLADEVTSMRRVLEATDNPRAIARIEMRVAEVARNVEAALNTDFNARRRAESDGILRFEATLNEIATRIDGLLDRATPGHDAIAALDERMAALSARLDGLDTIQLGPVAALDEIKREIVSLRGEMATREPPRVDRLESQLTTLVGHLADVEAYQNRPLALLDEIRSEIHALRRDVATNPVATPVSDKRLEEQVAELARRLDAASKPGASEESLSELEAQVARLARDLEASGPRSGEVKQLESDLARLQAAMFQSREQSIDAARAAARQAVDELAASRVDNDILRALREDLENVRRVAGSADEQSRATGGAVHDALSTVADRLNRLEAGTAPAAEAPAASEAPMALSVPVPARAPAWGPVASPEPAPAKSDLAALRELAGAAPNQPRDRKADFIAAARRAAQAAAAETARTVEKEAPSPQKSGEGAFARIGKAIRNRRRPLLLAAAAIVLAIGAVQLYGERIGGFVEKNAAPLLAAMKAPAAAPAVATPPAKPASADKSADRLAPAEPVVGATGAIAPIPAPASREAMVAPTEEDSTSLAFAEPENFQDRFGGTALAPDADGFSAPGAGTRTAALGDIPQGTLAGAAPRPDPAIGGPRLIEAAVAGDAGAAFEVAVRYAEGRGVPTDLGKAGIWYRRAAEAGVAVAQYRLGSLYERGQGVDKDLHEAVAWYQRAADQGNVGAMHNLAVLMSEGVDGSPDHVKALQWFRTAADYGVKDSQYNLGVIYARGLGVGADLAEAFKWFSIAAAQGDNDAATRRDEVAKAMSPALLEQAQALLRAWHPKPALSDANAVATPERGWDDPVGRVTEADRRQLVLKIQTLLAEQGYDVGVADGLEGPKTREAVKAFQKTIGMAETGVIGRDLLVALSTPSG